MHRKSVVMELALVLALALGAAHAFAQEVRIVTSGALAAPVTDLKPGLEKAVGRPVEIIYGSSQGGAADSIPERLKRGEAAHVLLLGRDALDGLVKAGLAQGSGIEDIVRSRMGMSVRLGLPKPDITTVEAFKKTLLEANSIAYSASVSGTYLSTVVFPQLGITDAVMPKAKRIMSERIGAVLARGEADIGVQQISELLPFAKSTQFVGPLPEGVQRAAVFSAGFSQSVSERVLAERIVATLRSAQVHPILRKHALEPLSATPEAQALATAFAQQGVLRAVINLGNPVLARRSESAEITGVSVDMARGLAQRLGVILELVPVTSAGAAVETMRKGDADIGFFAIDPARSDGIDFSSAYVTIVGAYAVRPGSALKSVDEVDRAGTRIVVGRNSAYDLFLSRALKSATLVRAPTSPEVVPMFFAENYDVAAGVRQQLEAEIARRPGELRLLDGAFMTINQAVGLASGRAPAALAFLKAFVEDAKASGFVAEALRRHGIEGANVAPPAP